MRPRLDELDRRIIALAVPAVAALATDPLYELCDTAILGHLGRSQLAGAAVAASILLTVSAAFIFLSFATTAAVARLVGRDDRTGATRHSVQVMWLGLAIGLLVTAALAPFGRVLVGAFGAGGEVAGFARTYFNVSLAGIPAFLVTMAGAGVHRGRQNTVRVLWVNGSGVLLNLFLEVVLVYGFGLGVGASALATVVAKWLVAAVYVVDVVRFARADGVALRPELAAIRRIGVSGGPLLVRTLALRGALTVGVAAAGRIGTAELAAFSIAFQIWSFLAYLADGLETAGQAMLGLELGRGSIEAARTVGRRLLRWAVWTGALGMIVVVAIRPVIGSVFTTDPAVLALFAESMWFVALAQPINTVTFTLDGILVGADDLPFLAAAMVVAGVTYVGLIVALRLADAGLAWLWAAQLAFMGFRAVALGVRFAGRRWERRSVEVSSCQQPTC